MRAALYLRVSTARQAEKDLSIPDQRRHLEAFCKGKGWSVEAAYEERGASATDDKRAVFQTMIEAACGFDHPFDVILVHSLSRFFRNAVGAGVYENKLEKAGVFLVSATQDVGNDSAGRFTKQIIAAADEFNSSENAKHVLRAMKENTRRGFWNGAPPPYGYRSIAVEQRADTIKKRLEIDPAEAEIVRTVFQLYLGMSGHAPMGIRALAAHLNDRGLRYRRGKAFASARVHEILTRTAYVGTHYFNRKTFKTKKLKDQGEWVELKTPVIIEHETFNRVQRTLEQRRPANTPPRVVNGPTLLTGMAKCSHCGGGMTLRTGKGGRYRYYACNNALTKGKSVCKGQSIRMDRLDEIVISEVLERVLIPERTKALLETLLDRQSTKAGDMAVQAKELRRQLRESENRIERLFDALADGTVDDTQGFRANLSKHQRQREELLRLVSSLDRRREFPREMLSARNVERFSTAVQAQLRNPDSKLRKAYIRQFVAHVEVSDQEIRISGPKTALLDGLAHQASDQKGQVLSFDREWWARQDSNLRPDRYERPALTN
jgi:site-specific DNA recombinase